MEVAPRPPLGWRAAVSLTRLHQGVCVSLMYFDRYGESVYLYLYLHLYLYVHQYQYRYRYLCLYLHLYLYLYMYLNSYL